MHFRPEEVDGFMEFFQEIRHKIEAMPGAIKVQLYQDENDPSILFTLSQWLNESHLNGYRKSELFGYVWPRTKALFSQKPEAWSLNLK